MLREPIKHCYFALSRLALIYLVTAHLALAQGSAFTYQGKLTDGVNPANGSYDIQIKLFDSTDFVTGTQQGPTLTNSAVQVTNGAFTVQLDFGPGVFGGAPRFLEIGLRPAGSPNAFTVLSPRQPLTSAPYAVRSATAASADSAANATNATNADQLGGIAASQYVVTTDARLSNARPPTAGSMNYIQNRTSQQGATNFNISGDGTAGGTLSANALNATTQFNIGGSRVLSVAGTNNVFAGISAGEANTTGNSNSFFGHSAGLLSTSGNLNSFFGSGAGRDNTTGGANSFFGDAAGPVNTTGVNNSFFGHSAGLGNTTGCCNSFVGFQAGFRNTTGNNNTFIGRDANFASSPATGDSNTLLGANSRVNSGVSNSTAIGAAATVTTSNTIVLGTSSERVAIPGLGSVGGSALCRNASLQISFCSSSVRYKDHLAPFNAGLELVNKLHPITFNWKQSGERDLGLGAEDVNEIEPLLVTHNDEGEIEGVKYDRITVVLVNAIKQQQAQINAMKKIICKDHPDAEVCKSVGKQAAPREWR